MLEPQLHLDLENVNRELREIELGRPRLDRPTYPRRSRFRTLLGAFARPPARVALEAGMSVPEVTIRAARTADSPDLGRLAEISERRLPHGLVLVAEVESDIVAALPVESGVLLSDLWRPTADVVQLLELRSEQIRALERSRSAA